MIDELLESSGAILRGHFLLSSGRHSDVYFEKFRVLERPDVLTALCARIVDNFRTHGVQLVAGPTTGGVIVAFEVARQLGCPALYVESVEGVKTLRRGAGFQPGTRVLLVDDVLTTGLSLREVETLIVGNGGLVVGAAALIDRSEHDPQLSCNVFAAHLVNAKSYSPLEIPSWLADVPISKPGTRA